MQHATNVLAVVRGHPRHLVLFAVVAGLLCGGWAPVLTAVPALAAVALAGRAGVAVLAGAAVIGGAALGAARVDAIDRGSLPVRLGAHLDADLTLLEPLRRRASGEFVARAELVTGIARGEQLLLGYRPPAAGLAPPARPGDVVRARGTLVALGEFDRLHRRRGALARLRAWQLTPASRVREGALGFVDGVRRRAEAALQEGLGPRQAALLAGMVLGQDDRIEDGVRDAFEASGLAHLLAVSGTNVMLLATLVVWVGAASGAPLRWRLFAALALIAVYVPLTGAGPSIQRAGVMGAAGLVAVLAGRPASRWYALGLAAAVTLALNPYAAGEPGWQLSFAAVVGLLWLAAPLREVLERRAPRPVAEVAAMTVAATVATAPLLAAHFGEVSLVSLPANLVAAPAVAPVMWLGMLAAAVGQVSPDLAWPLNALNAPLLWFVGQTARVAAAAPGATADVAVGGFAGAAAAYAVLAVVVVGGRLAWRRPRFASRARRLAPVLAGAAMLMLAAAYAWHGSTGEPLRPGETAVAILDIGQGDATLVRRGAAAVLFDTGPPQGPVVERLREEGVRRLDALVLTHAQADHEGAALPVIRDFRPRLIVDGGAGWPTAVQRALPAAAAQAKARVVRAAAGDVLRIGELTLRVLWPPAALAELPPEGDANRRALVTHLRSGSFDLLLTADAESEATGALAMPRVEALKVAHHGSDDPGLPAQLDQMRPQVAAIQVGRGNTYGHPTASTLAALRPVAHVFRTDRDGTIRLRSFRGRLTVETSR